MFVKALQRRPMWGVALSVLLQADPAQTPLQIAQPQGFCFAEAARREHVNTDVLMAIAWHESHLWPWRVHRNSNGTTDYGLMQINSRNLPSLKLTPETVMPICANILAGARLYHRAVQRYGNTWAAVGAYHSTTPALQQRYAQEIASSFQIISWLDAQWSQLWHLGAGLQAW